MEEVLHNTHPSPATNGVEITVTAHHSLGAEEPPDDADALVDTTFAALSDVRRRHALYYLRDRESATLDELATALVGWLNAREDGAAVGTPDDREHVRVGLHHGQLPKLSAAGLVRYDPDSGEVALADLPEFVEVAIDRSLALDRERAEERDRQDRRDRSDASNRDYT